MYHQRPDGLKETKKMLRELEFYSDEELGIGNVKVLIN